MDDNSSLMHLLTFWTDVRKKLSSSSEGVVVATNTRLKERARTCCFFLFVLHAYVLESRRFLPGSGLQTHWQKSAAGCFFFSLAFWRFPHLSTIYSSGCLSICLPFALPRLFTSHVHDYQTLYTRLARRCLYGIPTRAIHVLLSA